MYVEKSKTEMDSFNEPNIRELFFFFFNLYRLVRSTFKQTGLLLTNRTWYIQMDKSRISTMVLEDLLQQVWFASAAPYNLKDLKDLIISHCQIQQDTLNAL